MVLLYSAVLSHKRFGFFHSRSHIGTVSIGSDFIYKILDHWRAADHDLDLIANAGLLERLSGLFYLRHRCGQQRRITDNLRIVFLDRIHKLLGGDVVPKSTTLKPAP